jgi:hypothetical protein
MSPPSPPAADRESERAVMSGMTRPGTGRYHGDTEDQTADQTMV